MSGLIERLFPDQTGRWGHWLPVPLALGIALYFALKTEPAQIWLWVTLIGGSLALALSVTLQALSFGRMARLTAAMALVALGFGVADLRAHQVAAPKLYDKTGVLQLEGTVLAIDPPTGRGLRLTLGDVAIADWPAEATPRKVRISLRPQDTAEPGTRLRLTALLLPPPGPAFDGGYDYARTAWFSGIGATGFAVRAPEVLPVPARDMAARIAKWRARIADTITEAVPGQAGQMMAALSVGFTGGIAPAETEAWRASGLAHIISISGLHMAIVAGSLFFLVRLLLACVPAIALRYPIKKWAAVVALMGAGVYLLLSGNQPPALRAFLMAAVAFSAILVDRRAISHRSLAVAATLILLITPEVVISASFQMSFMATLALVALYEAVQARPRVRSQHPVWRGIYWLIGILIADILTSLVAGMATAPFAAHHFNRASSYGLIANMLAAPITAFWVMPGLGLGLVLSPFGWGDEVLRATGQGVGVLSAIAHQIAALPRASVWVPSSTPGFLLLTALGMCWLCLWRGPVRWLGLPLALTSTLLAFTQTRDLAFISADLKTVLVMGRTLNAPSYALKPRFNCFVSESWLKKQGGSADLRPLSCDPQGCVTPEGAALQLALAREVEAAAEDCTQADVVILSDRISPDLRMGCRAKILVDDWTVREQGGVRIRRQADGRLVYLPARDVLITRLWTGA